MVKTEQINKATKLNYQSGQVLLLAVMLTATIISVVMSVVYKNSVETKTAKLQEESNRAMSAAEAAIDKAISEKITSGHNVFGSGGLGMDNLQGIDVSSSSVNATGTSSNRFVSPLTEKDSQYTFYLSAYAYSGGVYTFGAPPAGGSVILHYNDRTSNCDDVALEIDIVAGNSGSYGITRQIADYGRHLSASQGVANNNTVHGFEDVSFACRTSAIALPANARLMIVRPLTFVPAASGTRIGFEASSLSFPSQGTIYSSEAKTASGVTKQVELFQSKPQIPAEFFITSF